MASRRFILGTFFSTQKFPFFCFGNHANTNIKMVWPIGGSANVGHIFKIHLSPDRSSYIGL
jgi:hypothetical protein